MNGIEGIAGNDVTINCFSSSASAFICRSCVPFVLLVCVMTDRDVVEIEIKR